MSLATQAVADAAVAVEHDVRRDDVIAVLRNLISVDAAHLLTNGVVGSEGVLDAADFFAGAQEPPIRRARARSTTKAATGSSTDSAAARTDDPETGDVVGRMPEPNRVQQPSADEIRRRTKLIAGQVQARTMLQAAEGSVLTAQSHVDEARATLDAASAALAHASTAVDVATVALGKAEATLSKRHQDCSEAQQQAERIDAELRRFDDT